MSDANRIRDEEHFRQVERAMLYVDEAARRVAETAKALKDDGGSPHLVSALETAAGSLRTDHKRLLQSVYWKVPDQGGQGELVEVDQDQERLAS